MSFVIFFLILSSLVLIHEFGHFFVAKRSGVKVHEFGLGLPPKLFGKKFGETEYTYNLLPIGGFVRIEGEDPDEKVSEPKRSFQNKSVRVRLSILLAGIFMNTVLAIGLFYAYFIFNGFISNPLISFSDYKFIGGNVVEVNTMVSDVANDQVKDKIYVGDIIFNAKTDTSSMNTLDTVSIKMASKSERVKDIASVNLQDFQNFINTSDGDVDIYLYNVQTDEAKQVTITPVYNEELDRKVVGVLLGSVFYLDYSESNVSKALSGVYHSYNILGYSMSTFASIISYSFETKDVSVVSQGVSGPVGIFSVVDGVLKSGSPNIFWIIIDLTALLSLSLAFMNLLPIPALDGGRAVFILIEGITKKKVNPAIEGQLHKFGMLFLLALLALITFKDVLQFF